MRINETRLLQRWLRLEACATGRQRGVPLPLSGGAPACRTYDEPAPQHSPPLRQTLTRQTNCAQQYIFMILTF